MNIRKQFMDDLMLNRDHEILETVINSIEDAQLRERTLVEWEYAPYIERNHPLLEALALNLGLTNEQIDQGFIDGSQL